MSSRIEINDLFATALSGIGIIPEARLLTHLTTHFNLLHKWNATFNLTSLENPEEIIDRLYIDSILLAQSIPPETVEIFDIGSGPGFPGIPILMNMPTINLKIVEPREKMRAFLAETAFILKDLPKFDVLRSRCDAKPFIKMYGQGINCAVSKGFAPLPTALALMRPLIPVNGLYITCLNEDSPLDNLTSDSFILVKDTIHRLPLTGYTTRHVVFRRNSSE